MVPLPPPVTSPVAFAKVCVLAVVQDQLDVVGLVFESEGDRLLHAAIINGNVDLFPEEPSWGRMPLC